MAAISSEVATGRKMNGRDGLTANQSFAFSGRRPRSAGLAGRLANDDFRAIGQLVEIIRDDHRARINSFHRRNRAVGGVDRDDLQGDGFQLVGLLRVEQINERAVGVALNRRVGQKRHAGQRVHEQPRVHELVREKRFIFVRENGLELDRAGGRVNLVVQRLPACPSPVFSVARGQTHPRPIDFPGATVFGFAADHPPPR